MHHGSLLTIFSSGVCLGSLNKLHEYIRHQGAMKPVASGGPHKYANQTELNIFGYLEAHPLYLERFNLHMGGYHQSMTFWAHPKLYPVQQRLAEGFNHRSDSVMLVDIGGSVGHDLKDFLDMHPTVPGRMIVQDLPQVIKMARVVGSRIEAMAHDFHTPQPIRGQSCILLLLPS